jgi:hypothetical protein
MGCRAPAPPAAASEPASEAPTARSGVVLVVVCVSAVRIVIPSAGVAVLVAVVGVTNGIVLRGFVVRRSNVLSVPILAAAIVSIPPPRRRAVLLDALLVVGLLPRVAGTLRRA